jgi:4-amino-4-deoxy-L-arabinose transferase-like glycosyltransferase
MIAAIIIPISQQKTRLRFTNRFPSHLPDAILSAHLKSINYALLFFCCLFFHLVGTWSLPLIDRDEPRFAEASREMIERDDYIVPFFNDRFRFDKPPLAYWMQIASYKTFGENDFAARFPSAIAAALVAVSILAWGSGIGGEKVGWWAAIVFTLSLQTFLHAKAAVADMWLVLFVTLAHWSGYELFGLSAEHSTLTPPSQGYGATSAQRSTSNWLWWSIFYLSLAFGFLAKGPIAWTPLLTVGLTGLFGLETRLGSRFKFVRGTLLMLAVVALWGIPALIRTHGEFFTIGIGRHVLGRSFGAMEGHGANSLGMYLLLLPFYFVTIFISFLPWSIKLPGLTRQLWQKRDSIDNYLIGGGAIIFVIFSLIKTKLPHYTLPALPLLSLLLARRFFENERFFKRCAIGAVSVYLVLAFFLVPFGARFFPAWQLYRQSRDYLRPEMQFAAADYVEPSLVWYFRGHVHGFMTTLNHDTVRPFMEGTGGRFVILPTNLVRDLFPSPPSNWKTFSTRGFNIAKGKSVDLTLVLKPE